MHPADEFRRAVEARDHDALAGLFAEDIRFFSPVTFRPFEGAALTGQVFRVLLRTFQDFRYVGQYSGSVESENGGDVDSHALVFRTAVGETLVHGIDLLRFDEDGRLSELTVMIRPLRALNVVSEAIQAGLIADGVLPAT